MEKRLKSYIRFLQETIDSGDADRIKKAHSDILTEISFFQHERLIHLIVTVTFALLALMTLIFYTVTSVFAALILFLLFMSLLIPYIRHYYILENGTQHLYELYDIMSRIPDNG